ncbi:CRISPR system Cascade subunit CasE [Frankia sp. AiPs1]|uniref:type I-E CRISPR-associated protein Cas6/Cse3/CasE n=1 Tax=Frankia sp. AiPa1 TaxID=573492 RepID=UPI00202B0DAE|nr:type I-E CRISPR-associated protein Cas6/Cse3/CasE [Frankia sp. AiPa1]MCL9760952.1 type I-E CRISPR-associated protein Cas6/Cse3/CasE [Frankia sp. AiPa1]
MYLTRVILNPRRAGAQNYLANPYSTHAAIMLGLPTGLGGSVAGRPLWRIDRDDPHRPHLLTVTQDRPDYSHIVEEAGFPAWDEPYATKHYQPFLDRLETGQRYAFRLTANPTYSQPSPIPESEPRAAQLGKASSSAQTTDQARTSAPTETPDLAPTKRPRGTRRPHTTITDQTQWFLRQAEKIGITIPTANSGAPDLIITERRRHAFEKPTPDDTPRRRSRNTIAIHTATFQGNLRITAPDDLRTALTHGIGTAKGFGCGLLTLTLHRATPT